MSAAGVTEDHESRVLLVRQKGGDLWSFPAGGVEDGERIKEALRREFKEETGLDSGIVDLIGIYDLFESSDTKVGFAFRVRITGGTLSPNPEEIAEARFFSREEIKQLIREGKIYKPHYTIAVLTDWVNERSFSADIIKVVL
jgi:NAD+ diphosphatase